MSEAVVIERYRDSDAVLVAPLMECATTTPWLSMSDDQTPAD